MARVCGYAVASRLDDELLASAQLSPAERVEALELPPLDERIPRLALDMTAGSATAEDRARALERRLRHDYGYTLELLPAPVADPLATFLFARKRALRIFRLRDGGDASLAGHSFARRDRIHERRLQSDDRMAGGARLRCA